MVAADPTADLDEASPPAPVPPEPLRALARATSPLLRGEEVRLCLAGPRGSGKSALLRRFLPELNGAAAERGADLPVYFVDGRLLGTAYLLLAALVRLSGGDVPSTGWSWERLVEAWRSRAREGVVVALDHADEAEGAEGLLRLLARHSPALRGLIVAARSGSPLAQGWGAAVTLSPEPEAPPGPPPPRLLLERVPEVPAPGLLPLLAPPPSAIDPVAAPGDWRADEPVEAAHCGPPSSAPPRRSIPDAPMERPHLPMERPDPPRERGRTARDGLPAYAFPSIPPARLALLPPAAFPPPLPTPGLETGSAGGSTDTPTTTHPKTETPPPAPHSRRAGPPHLSPPRPALLDDAPRLLLQLLTREGGRVPTGHLWKAYGRAAPEAGLRPLTLRRVSGLLGELERGGWVSAPVVSRGRRGRTKWAALTGEAHRALREEPRPLPPEPVEAAVNG